MSGHDICSHAVPMEEPCEKCLQDYMKERKRNARIQAIADLKAENNRLRARVDELSMLVRMLVHSVRKTSPDNETARKAMDYLQRHNLQGSILRDILRDEADYGAGDCVRTD